MNPTTKNRENALQGVLPQWADLLGGQNVLTTQHHLGPYARTTSPLPGHAPAAILLPDSTQQVSQIAKTANEYGIPLYPISCGKNWGYGDACAPTPGQVIVDLKRMNRVLEVNTKLAYAVIEPGVTQGQLSDYLKKHAPDLWMDSTGAGLSASIVGNSLDRGCGHTSYGDHFLNTCGMQVVLADGRVLDTGLGHFQGAKASRVYRYGVGPFVDGLFSQSNFGIVTQACIWLMPKPQRCLAFLFSAPDDGDLTDVIDRLAPLRLERQLTSTLHIANDLRVISSRTRYPWQETNGATPLPQDVRQALCRRFGVGAWNGLGAIYGTSGTARAIKRELKRALRPYKLRFVDDRMIAAAKAARRVLGWVGLGATLGEMVELIEPVYGLLKGQPSNEHLAGTGWRVRDQGPPQAVDPLDAHAGLMWISPILPLSGQAATEVMTILEPIYRKHGFEPLVTFTMISERAMLCISNIAFDKRQETESAAAQVCYNELVTTLTETGYIPYRTGPQGFAKLSAPPSVFWDVAGQLKQALDPSGILSPGRYIPVPDENTA